MSLLADLSAAWRRRSEPLTLAEWKALPAAFRGPRPAPVRRPRTVNRPVVDLRPVAAPVAAPRTRRASAPAVVHPVTPSQGPTCPELEAWLESHHDTAWKYKPYRAPRRTALRAMTPRARAAEEARIRAFVGAK